MMKPFNAMGSPEVERGIREFFDMTSRQHQDGPPLVSVNISMEPELLTSFCRRGRQRLRAIRDSCKANLKLDRYNGILRVTGTEAAVEAVRRELSSLGGPRRAVPAAVWAELMRTRMMRSSSQALVLHIQAESGCRIHIERSWQEVRLFGPNESVAVADQMLEDLAAMCTQECVLVPPGNHMESPAIQALARQCGVTLRIEDQMIVAMGMREPVAVAALELQKYARDPMNYQPEVVNSAAAENGKWSPETGRPYVWSDQEVEEGPEENGVVTNTLPPPVRPGDHQTTQKAARNQNAAKNHGDRNRTAAQAGCKHMDMCKACPTCGAARFCVYCGAQNWRSGTLQEVHPTTFLGNGGFAAEPRHPGRSWENSTASNPSLPGTPEPERANWVSQLPYVPFEGPGSSANTSTGRGMPNRGHAAMVPQGMVPVCFPTNMVPPQVHNGGRTSSMPAVQGGMAHTVPASSPSAAPSMMQACMVPASMMQACVMGQSSGRNCSGGNNNSADGNNGGNMAFCAVPAPYYHMQESGPAMGG